MVWVERKIWNGYWIDMYNYEDRTTTEGDISHLEFEIDVFDIV